MSDRKNALALVSLETFSSIEQGTAVTVKRHGKPVFIRHITEDDVQLTNSVEVTSLHDPHKDSARVKDTKAAFGTAYLSVYLLDKVAKKLIVLFGTTYLPTYLDKSAAYLSANLLISCLLISFSRPKQTLSVCTHLGCMPLPNAGDYGGWFCLCHYYCDIAGRIR